MKFKPRNYVCKVCKNKTYCFYEKCSKCGAKHSIELVKEIPIQNINFEDKPEEMETLPFGKYQFIGESIGKLVDEKNKAYGDSFHKAGDFLKILYPNGVSPEQYSDMLAIVRIFDKLMRIATDKDALGENPFRDIAGYSILKCEGE